MRLTTSLRMIAPTNAISSELSWTTLVLLAEPIKPRRFLNDSPPRKAPTTPTTMRDCIPRAASACVMEFIARAFPFRHAPNQRYARTIFLLADGDEELFADSSWQAVDSALLGRGAQEPLLGLPALAPPRALA